MLAFLCIYYYCTAHNLTYYLLSSATRFGRHWALYRYSPSIACHTTTPRLGCSPINFLRCHAVSYSISLLDTSAEMDDRRGSSSSGAMRSNSATAADADLARMGYKSELPRNLSMLSVLGLSFAIMAVPYGLSTTMYITLTDGQSVTVIWGWVLISLISTSIAASLAEICAVYPTAGGETNH